MATCGHCGRKKERYGGQCPHCVQGRDTNEDTLGVIAGIFIIVFLIYAFTS
jgi:predicted ATP-dependent serine protease